MKQKDTIFLKVLNLQFIHIRSYAIYNFDLSFSIHFCWFYCTVYRSWLYCWVCFAV